MTVGPSLPGGPDLYFMNVTHYTLITNGCLHGVQTLILDAVVVSRLLRSLVKGESADCLRDLSHLYCME